MSDSQKKSDADLKQSETVERQQMLGEIEIGGGDFIYTSGDEDNEEVKEKWMEKDLSWLRTKLTIAVNILNDQSWLVENGKGDFDVTVIAAQAAAYLVVLVLNKTQEVNNGF